MSDWRSLRIDELVVRFATGLNPRKNFTLNSGGKNYYVTIKNFIDGVLYLDAQCDKIDDDALKLIDKRSDLKKGDILFSSIGRVGDAYRIEKKPKNWNINESVFTLRPNAKVVVSEFLYYLLKSDTVKKELEDSATGSTLTSIKMGHLKSIELFVPSNLDEQRRIAQVLSDIDDEIAILESVVAKKRQIKTAVMQKLLTGKVRLLPNGEAVENVSETRERESSASTHGDESSWEKF